MDWPVLMSSIDCYFIISRRYCGEDETLPSDLCTKYSPLLLAHTSRAGQSSGAELAVQLREHDFASWLFPIYEIHS